MKEILSYSDVTEWKGAFLGEDGESSSILVTREGDRNSLLVPPFYAGDRRCHYCQRQMEMLVEPRQSHELADAHAFVMVDTTRYACLNCGWWYVTRLRERRAEGIESGFHRKLMQFEGILRRWGIADFDVPVSVLRQHLAKTPTDYGDLNPHLFERLVADVFRDFFHAEVLHVGRTGDDGIDIFAVIGDETFLIQVKRRENLNSKEGVQVVREFVGAVAGSDHTQAYLVTSAKGFTEAAMEFVERKSLERRKVHLQLIALPEFARMLNLTTTQIPPLFHTF